MIKHPSLLQQFRSFCFQNHIQDPALAVEYFAVFGGTGWDIDTSIPLEKLIEEKVLKNYKYIHAEITEITQSNQTRHAILTALATGDRREHTAFKKAKVSRKDGEHIIDFLIEKELIQMENSLLKPPKEQEISDKLHFNKPFYRFWFALISPYYKGIKSGDYTEMQTKFKESKQDFLHYTHLMLSRELTKQMLESDVKKVGGYWDQEINIDLFAKNSDKSYIAGLCKVAKKSASKNDLIALQEACKKAKLEIDTFVIYATNKFSNELKKERDAKLLLLSPKHLKHLVQDLSKTDLLVHKNKRY